MVEVVVDQKPAPQLPYDPDVIPPAVKKRAAAVEAFYKAQEGQSEPAPSAVEAPPAEPAPPVVEPLSEVLPAEPTPPEPKFKPIVDESVSSPSTEDENTDSWKRRFLRMQGQFNASQKTIGEMQEQMTQLGSELLQAQQFISSMRREPAPQQQQPVNYLTEQDVQTYGTELVNFTQRAAAQAVAPHLQRIEQENAQLRDRLSKEAKHNLDRAVEAAVPNYLEIDRNPRWHKWLLSLDLLAGRVRQQLLNEAIASADAPRVISFFRSFLQDEQATGHIEPAPTSLQAAAPREPAVPLASLAAPGRARPASGGETFVPPEKPSYSRAQIAQLYRQHQRGAYAGREAEWARQEADIIAAGREGRVR